MDHSGNRFGGNDGRGANVFSWSVKNATRYEILGRQGQVLYSGSGNRWVVPDFTLHAAIGWPTTFKAYNGPNATSPVQIISYDPNEVDITTPDPSG